MSEPGDSTTGSADDVTTEVLAAAAALVEAFGSGDLPAYFAAFDDDATFIFHPTDRVLSSVAEYRDEWATWAREDGFRVLSCESSGQRVQVLGDVAVFSHAVHTRVATHDGESDLRERETIVFARRGSDGGAVATRWRAVHEHLSLDPDPDPDPEATAGAGADPA